MTTLSRFLLLVPVLWICWSCERPTNPVEEGTLTFSQDTLAFDSIFTTLLTPSERLIVHNETGRAVNISRVWLESGEKTRFSMIINGRQGNDISDVVIANGDSVYVFVNFLSTLRDEFVEEYINFQVGEEQQRVLIRARVLDAYFLRARLAQEGNFLSLTPESFFFRQDTTLTPDKPIIIDGPVFIPEGVTVTILPGTELFFTPYQFGVRDSNQGLVFGLYSFLIVDGTLQAVGTADQPIEFKGSRFDSLYLENPAQWRGLNFRKNSRNNVLQFCEVKNALIGIQVDSSSVNENPKLTLRQTEVKNMGVHGIVGLGFAPGQTDNEPPAILMENCIVNSCKQRTVLILGGGKYEFVNSTFANFNVARFSRRIPQVLATNWYSFDGSTGIVYPAYVDFVNCIIWGSEEDEIVKDTLIGAPFTRLRLERCMVRLSPDNEPFIRPLLVESLVNQDPLFNDYFFRDYRLKEGSPAINAGLDLSARFQDDYRGRPDSLRYDGFDIGALEYYPLEK